MERKSTEGPFKGVAKEPDGATLPLLRLAPAAQGFQDVGGGAAGDRQAVPLLHGADGGEVWRPITPSATPPMSKPARIRRLCSSRRPARSSGRSLVGQGVAMGPPPRSRSARWPIDSAYTMVGLYW